MSDEEVKISHEEFLMKAILKLRNISKSKGIHSVFSGFNAAFRKYFDEDPIPVTQRLHSEGKIDLKPVKKGVMLYLPGEGPASRTDLGEEALSTILGTPPEKHSDLYNTILEQLKSNEKLDFPQDFMPVDLSEEEFDVISLPGTALVIDNNSHTVITSPKGTFKLNAKNPPIAKFIYYAHIVGETQLKIPRNSGIVMTIVVEYEKRCRTLISNIYSQFLVHTNDEDLANQMTKEISKELGLRIIQ